MPNLADLLGGGVPRSRGMSPAGDTSSVDLAALLSRQQGAPTEFTTEPMVFDQSRENITLDPMQFEVGRRHVTTDPLVFNMAPPEHHTLPPMQVQVPSRGAPQAARQRGSRPQARRGGRSDEDVFISLLEKMTPGAAAPGEGMIAFGDLPPDVQKIAGSFHGQPLVGIDPNQLDTQERYLLEKLRRANQQQVQQRVDAREAQRGPYGGMPGRGGGV